MHNLPVLAKGAYRCTALVHPLDAARLGLFDGGMAQVRAALSGRTTVSTLSVNDATSVPSRLLNLGVEPYLVASGLRASVAQRLLERLCPACRAPVELTEEQRQLLGAPEGQRAFAAPGCEACLGTGRQGGVAIYEVATFGDAMGELILQGASAQELRAQAVKDGMTTLRQHALRLLGEGQVSVASVLRCSVA